jgi:hypothetical protein
LCTDSCNMGPCIIILKHEVMAVDECHDNGPQDLVTVSLCIQVAIIVCSLCLPIPIATKGHSVGGGRVA